ncbi:TetR/AcrR family transcriptional regulator [Saccharopolyspora griseoalba]|uniref:TetR/AcrR family transcriptional regulator n=1 Tax=Saccharopolyspora griseoalba TaxID=1431848 RepID=A0ABW2LRV5_9PSEU
MTASATPQVDGRSARWAGHRERRRGELIDAAVRAIAKHGPDVSVEQMAEEAGVARTRLYRYFNDAADLGGAVADRAAEMITTEMAAVFSVRATPLELTRSAIGAHINWLTEHGDLYRYLTMHALSSGHHAINDVKTVIARQLVEVFELYLRSFGAESEDVLDPLAHGIVGMVESSANNWLDAPGEITADQLAEWLTSWTWTLLDHTLRARGLEIDPEAPLPLPDD